MVNLRSFRSHTPTTWIAFRARKATEQECIGRPAIITERQQIRRRVEEWQEGWSWDLLDQIGEVLHSKIQGKMEGKPIRSEFDAVSFLLAVAISFRTLHKLTKEELNSR